jgi:hypothetical protein
MPAPTLEVEQMKVLSMTRICVAVSAFAAATIDAAKAMAITARIDKSTLPPGTV